MASFCVNMPLPIPMVPQWLLIDEEWPGQEGGKEGTQPVGEVQGVHVGSGVPACPDVQQQWVASCDQEPRAKPLVTDKVKISMLIYK